MKKSSVLALDQGTTSSRAIVFSRDGQIVAVAQQEFEQILPTPGHVEHADSPLSIPGPCRRPAFAEKRPCATR